jgi:hypothetical protein
MRRTIRVGDRYKAPKLEVGWQTIRKIGRAETLKNVELFKYICEYRLKAEFTLVRVIDTLGHRKRLEPVNRASRCRHILPFLCLSPLCVIAQTGLTQLSHHGR